MFMFILEILTAEESRPKGSRPFIALPKKKGWKRSKKVREPSKAPVPPKAAPHPPSPSPSLLSALMQAILRMPTTRDTLLPPVTLSQVEDTLATSEMVQALHKHPPPPALSPSVMPDASTVASPVHESRPMPQVWYAKNPHLQTSNGSRPGCRPPWRLGSWPKGCGSLSMGPNQTGRSGQPAKVFSGMLKLASSWIKHRTPLPPLH